MDEIFGKDDSYGVFVRSDTNVEDLSGFTGAGLNLTVPNVVGFKNISKAIPEVWASPFTQRAFAWRQAHMDQPEHVYTSVLLLRSVPSDKSGVMVTQDVDTGDRDWLSIVISEGVGGGVEGEAAESLRVNTKDGQTRLLAQATASTRTVIKPSGGVERLPVSGDDSVLKPEEIEQLLTLARELPERFPLIADADGNPAPADIEFGFLDGQLRLFQIRPFLESRQARGSDYLRSLDKGIEKNLNTVIVTMDAKPEEKTK
jgi:phosphoenolpyruvate synthase/pyruvate phosphate dikinase